MTVDWLCLSEKKGQGAARIYCLNDQGDITLFFPLVRRLPLPIYHPWKNVPKCQVSKSRTMITVIAKVIISWMTLRTLTHWDCRPGSTGRRSISQCSFPYVPPVLPAVLSCQYGRSLVAVLCIQMRTLTFNMNDYLRDSLKRRSKCLHKHLLET